MQNVPIPPLQIQRQGVRNAMTNKVFEAFPEFSDYDRDQSYEIIRMHDQMLRLFFVTNADYILIKERYNAWKRMSLATHMMYGDCTGLFKETTD
jgi:hypothetical protein